MVIATIKAALVVTFFMHLFWDKKFHLILFFTALLFVVLFLSMSITDRGEYQGTIDQYQNSTLNTK
jgi:cytochrome c oxidase subunit 4